MTARRIALAALVALVAAVLGVCIGRAVLPQPLHTGAELTLTDDDARLAEHCLFGESQAQRALVERHRPAIWRLAHNATGSAEDAFDIAQQTFVAAFAALARYDASRPFGAWLTRIALNKCRDWSRRRAVRRLFEFGMPDGVEAGFAYDAALPTRLKDVLLPREDRAVSKSNGCRNPQLARLDRADMSILHAPRRFARQT